MAEYKKGPFAGDVSQNGKGDDARPKSVSEKEFEINGAKTFGEEWTIPPVLRKKRVQDSS